jgi:RimJ/RimL family protein N-acetyltransferase
VFIEHPSVSREVPEIPRDPRRVASFIDEQNHLELFEPKKCVNLAVERKSDGKVVGLVCLVSNGAGQGEIGWSLGIEHRGNGYITEAARALITFAFRELGYPRILAGTVFTNRASWRVMERLGMRKEAHFRKAHVPAEPGGEWIDTVRYAVLAEEWPEAPGTDLDPR